MKKLLLATLLAGTSTFAMANVSDLYVQGNIGVSKLETKADGEKYKDSNTGFAVVVGKDLGNVRYALDYTLYGKIKDHDSWEGGYDNLEFKAHSVGVSAVYDFQAVSGFTPYAGVRAGVNQFKLDWNGQDTAIDGTIESDSGSIKKTKVGAGVLAGVQYAINPQLALDAGVEYNYLGKVEDTKFNQYGAKVGLRYNF